MSKIKKLLCLSIAGLFFVPGVAFAVDVKLSGQVDRAVLLLDDGSNSEVLHVDNSNSSTRFRLTGDQSFGEYKVGVVWENEFVSNPSSKASVGQKNDGTADFKERKFEIWLGSDWGKLWMGQGDGAANGTSEIDLSGTTVAMYSDVGSTGGGTKFISSGGAAGPTISQTRNNLDGLSRNDRLRYDTPSFNGLVGSLSFTNGDAWELAGRYNRKYDGFGKIAAGLGFVDSGKRNAVNYKQYGLSVSWLHDSGFNLTLAYGKRDPRVGQDASNFYIKGGYKFGIHAVALEYGQTKDLALDGDESSNIGAAYVAKVWDGVEMFTTVRRYSLDRTAVSYDDIMAGMAGARVKF